MKILITGASGFLGSHLCADALRKNDEVHVLLRESSSLSQLDAHEIRDEVTVHRWLGDAASMAEIMKTAQPDVVCHCASLFISEHQSEDIDPLVDANIRLGMHLLEAMSANGVDALVNVGTSWQYYESSHYRPVNLYAATKEAFRTVLDYYCDARGLRCVDLKLYDVYGSLDPRKKLLPLLKGHAESGEPLDMSAGEQLVELNEVSDVVNALERAAQRVRDLKPGTFESFGVTGERCSLKDLVALVERVLGKTLNIQWGARPYRQREVMTPWVPPATLPGWKAEVSLEAGLKRLFNQ